MIGYDERVRIWGEKTKDEGLISFNRELLRQSTKTKIWGCICLEGVGIVTPVEGNINAAKYLDILEENLSPVFAKQFPQNGSFFFRTTLVHRTRLTQEYVTRKRMICLRWPAQSQELNIIEN